MVRGKRRLGSREAFAVPPIGTDVMPLPHLRANEGMTKAVPETPKGPTNEPRSGKSSTPEKSTQSLSNNELVELYTNCIKLATENKITQKNSWQLNLIDYMEDVVEQEVSGANPNFQAASFTLDAGVKIYACRVDSVHTDTYKVLGGLTRTEREVEDANAESEPEVPVTPATEAIEVEPSLPRKKSRKVHAVSATTIESNVENLNTKQLDVSFKVDPLFRKTSASFDQGGVKGLLLNQLFVHDGCTLVFDSADAVNFSDEAATTEDTYCDIADLCGLLEEGGDINNIDNLDICSAFPAFRFTDVEASADIPSVPESSESELSSDDFPETSNDSSFIGDTSLDKSSEVANTSWTEHGFTAPNVTLRLTGPDHWQFALPTPTSNKLETNKKPKKPSKKQTISFISFSDPLPDDISSVFAAVENERSITLPEHYHDKVSVRSTTLPALYVYPMQQLSQLFCKKYLGASAMSDDSSDSEGSSSQDRMSPIVNSDESFVQQAPLFRSTEVNREFEMQEVDDHQGVVGAYVMPKFNTWSTGEEVNIQTSNDDIPIGEPNEPDAGTWESLNTQQGGDEGNNMQQGIRMQGADEGSQQGESMEGGGEEVKVSVPQRVAVIPINYAKVATTVNVRELKAVVWDEVCQYLKAEETTVVPFELILDRVRTRIVQKNEKEKVGEVTTAMCFICTLHLCNEHKLSFEQQSIDDLRLVQNK